MLTERTAKLAAARRRYEKLLATLSLAETDLNTADAEHADAKKAAARIAMLASRTNTMLSIPMLYCMAAQSHGGF